MRPPEKRITGGPAAFGCLVWGRLAGGRLLGAPLAAARGGHSDQVQQLVLRSGQKKPSFKAADALSAFENKG